jgi:hypothetical protein
VSTLDPVTGDVGPLVHPCGVTAAVPVEAHSQRYTSDTNEQTEDVHTQLMGQQQ